MISPNGNSPIRSWPAYRFAPLEALEPRLLMSGNVVVRVVDGCLYLLGDAQANQIQVDQTGLPAGQYRVTGTAGTTLNGREGEFVVENVQALRIHLGRGDDAVTFQDLQLAGRVQVGLGYGDNTFEASAGTVGDLWLRSGQGDDVFDLGGFESSGLHLRVGGGADQITVDDLANLQRITANLGSGNDSFRVTTAPDADTLAGCANHLRGGRGNEEQCS